MLRSPSWYLLAITSSGIACPPRATRRATRAHAASIEGSQRKTSIIRYPAERHRSISRRCVRPAQVVSKAKLSPASTRTFRRSSIARPDATATRSGFKGESPRAISSAFTNSWISSTEERLATAHVVFPAPFGPPTITTLRVPSSSTVTPRDRRPRRRAPEIRSA